MIEIERDEAVATLFLTRPKVNALSPEMIDALLGTLDELFAGDGVGAVVLASRLEKVFSAGFDLKALDALEPERFGSFIESFALLYQRLAAASVPVVAAVGGHALAGGAILALACDRRVFGTGSWHFGLTEVDLGLPLPPGVLRLLTWIVGERRALEVGMFGRRYTPAEATEAGLADRMVAPDVLLTEARTEAAELAGKPRKALGAIRDQLRAPLHRELQTLDAEVGKAFRDWWYDPVAVERRRRFLSGSG